MTEKDRKCSIKAALKAFATGDISENALALFSAIGYNTARQSPFPQKSYSFFKESFLSYNTRFNEEKAFVKEWKTVDLLFQLTRDEVSNQRDLFNTRKVDNTIIETYLFFAVELSQANYSRTALAGITRELNKVFPMPVMILFRHGELITLSVINRRLNKKDEQKDVLEKVTLIKDISAENPHRAHIEILFDLSFEELKRVHNFTSFVELHNAWQKTLDTKELNKRFYREISNWYFWAVKEVCFPLEPTEVDAHQKKTDLRQLKHEHRAKNIIRMLTRFLFVWFIKEKKLVPEELFDSDYLKKEILKDLNPLHEDALFRQGDIKSSYYKAVLQNLFFASLNCPETPSRKNDTRKRGFRLKNNYGQHRDANYLMRYENQFRNPAGFLELINTVVPFLNGGLFECLDDKTNGVYIDGFSDNLPKPHQLRVPDYLFFGVAEEIDLSPEYGNKNKKYRNAKVKGLIYILKNYKFTVTENTPIEEDIALDPELLGRVFENLLASYNPETKTTARKQTGSFYTPREIVNYMVDESIKTYLKQKLETEASMNPEYAEVGLGFLIGYYEKEHLFNEKETAVLIHAIDNCKILDPACGSGAFPMGILHKLTHILHKLDPQNRRWKERQIEKAQTIDDCAVREQAINDIETAFSHNELDYGRKLYLIENCIYGVDIQPIATQISKLRFFISLIVDQKTDKSKENFGIRPLPNLETRFVAANTLIGIENPDQLPLFQTEELNQLEEKLKEVRHRLFSAKTPPTKRRLREEDKTLREKMGDILIANGWDNDTARKLAGWDPYDQNVSSSFFDREWMFGVNRGFDVVIGNPPYGAKFTKEEKECFKKIYKHQDYQPESFLLFTEKSFDLIRNYAVVSLIIPNTWLTNLKVKKIRKFLTGNNLIINISHYNKNVFDAVVDTEVILLKKGFITNNEVKVFKHLSANQVQEIKHNQNKWKEKNGDVINIFSDKKIEQLISTLENNSIYISDLYKIVVGMKPYQAGKGNPKQDRSIVNNRIFDSDKKIDQHYRKLLRGCDIYKYEINWDGKRWIKFGKWLAEPRFSANFDSKEKIVIRQTGDSLIATIDTNQFVCMNNLHVLTSKTDINLRFVLALINSTLLNFYFQYLNPEVGEALAEVKKTNVGKLPIKKINNETPFIVIVDYILSSKKTKSLSAIFFERLIDAMVCELYFPEKIKSAGCEVLKHMSNLPELKESLSDEKKLKTIKKLHQELSATTHPVYVAMEKMKEIEEIKIIEGRS